MCLENVLIALSEFMLSYFVFLEKCHSQNNPRETTHESQFSAALKHSMNVEELKMKNKSILNVKTMPSVVDSKGVHVE